MREPLNGTTTHPLSSIALDVLALLARAPVPRGLVNTGVVNRLERDKLAEITALPSPYKTHNGKRIAHLRITEAGRRALPCANPLALPPRVRVVALWRRWAAAVAAGAKPVETRGWPWPYPPGWLAICATLRADGEIAGERIALWPDCPEVEPQALCALVWVARCRPLERADLPRSLVYAPGLWAWDLERIHRLRPVPMLRAPQKFSSVDRSLVLEALEAR